MNDAGLSVAMCTFNGARFLWEQLESIASQTRLPDELVICDDRSTDNSFAICREFAPRAPFPVCIILNDTRIGAAKNFEKAISLCQHGIIVLCDQDDAWYPEKMNRVAEVLHNDRHVGAVFSDAELIDEDSQPMGMTLWSSGQFKLREQDMFEHGQGLRVMLKHPVITGATMAFRRDFRELVLPISPDEIHDRWIGLLVASVSKVSLIRERLVRYRKHSAQQLGLSNIDSTWKLIRTSRRMSRQQYILEAKRFNQVLERLYQGRGDFPPHPYALRLIEQKVKHEAVRGTLPKSKVLRLPTVVREAVSLRYWRYSSGFGSVAKDVMV